MIHHPSLISITNPKKKRNRKEKKKTEENLMKQSFFTLSCDNFQILDKKSKCSVPLTSPKGGKLTGEWADLTCSTESLVNVGSQNETHQRAADREGERVQGSLLTARNPRPTLIHPQSLNTSKNLLSDPRVVFNPRRRIRIRRMLLKVIRLLTHWNPFAVLVLNRGES